MNPSQNNAPNQPITRGAIMSSAQSKTLCLALGIALLPCTALCQVTQSQHDDPKALIARVQAGSYSNADIETILRAGVSLRVLPALEQQFAAETETFEQVIIASRLVRLGDENNTYWDFLLKQATLAVESDLPDPFHDSQGTLIGNKQLSSEFKAWIEAHHEEPGTAFQSWSIKLPGKVMLLGASGDQRGIPLLRRALQSHNYLIVVFAAKGLAFIQDKDSIPLIKVAIQRNPPELTSLIAESLIFFDDPLAQSTVDKYLPKERAKTIREAKAQGMGALGW